MKYECSKCGMAVIMTDEGPVKYCSCNEAIVANMQCEVVVDSSMNNK